MPKAIMAVLGCAVLLTIAGCGDDGSYANNPRPPSPLSVTAAVTPSGISVSPARIGAGPIMLIVANLTRSSQVVSLTPVTSAGGGPAAASTGPINPQGTASLQYDATQGEYQVRGAHGVAPTVLQVGPPRPSAQDQLLEP